MKRDAESRPRPPTGQNLRAFGQVAAACLDQAVARSVAFPGLAVAAPDCSGCSDPVVAFPDPVAAGLGCRADYLSDWDYSDLIGLPYECLLSHRSNVAPNRKLGTRTASIGSRAPSRLVGQVSYGPHLFGRKAPVSIAISIPTSGRDTHSRR